MLSCYLQISPNMVFGNGMPKFVQARAKSLLDILNFVIYGSSTDHATSYRFVLHIPEKQQSDSQKWEFTRNRKSGRSEGPRGAS